MGVQLYSRRKNRQWPNINRLAKRAKEAYESFLADVKFDLFYTYDYSVCDTYILTEKFIGNSFSNKDLQSRIKQYNKDRNEMSKAEKAAAERAAAKKAAIAEAALKAVFDAEQNRLYQE